MLIRPPTIASEFVNFAFFGNIFHGFTPDGNRELLEKPAWATTDRGTVAILDQITADSGSLLG